MSNLAVNRPQSIRTENVLETLGERMRSAVSRPDSCEDLESPDYVRLSLAAAMTLGFVKGWFYRNAQLGCINLLHAYKGGCRANCAFCGLSSEKRYEDGKKSSFIRVPWKTFDFPQTIEAIKNSPDHVGRVCISMVTHRRSKEDVLFHCREIVNRTGKSVSVLIAPSILGKDDLFRIKDAGADRIGVAIDAATPELFEKLRGKTVGGPHRWGNYWKIYEMSLEVFGAGMSGVHLICGLGESEKDITQAISRAKSLGGSTHLFSFFPEQGSAMQDHASPPIGTYRRIQLARWLIDNEKTRLELMSFDSSGKITDFGISKSQLDRTIDMGESFQTSGCPGPDGKVACNRPYGNEKPGEGIRNFPFVPDQEDLKRIRDELLF
jgi:lipoyl synthase